MIPFDTRYQAPKAAALALETAQCRITPGPGLTPFHVVVDRDADDPLSQAFLRGGHPGAELAALLARVVPPGARVIDLGAHVGAFALAAAAAGHQVLAVEASPVNAALLRASAEANAWGRLRVVHAGVSDRAGELPFVVRGPYGHMATAAEEGGGDVVRVPARTVDALLQELAWPRPDFVKIDIEGSEVAALAGMERTLSAPDAPILYCESNGHMLDLFGQTPQALKRQLARFGYRCLRLEGDRVTEVAPDDAQGPVVVDYLAVKQMPPALRGLRVRKGQPRRELAAELEAAGRDALAPVRLHAVRTLAAAPWLVREEAALAQLAEDLRRDADPAVREAAARLPVGAPAAWWARFFGHG